MQMALQQIDVCKLERWRFDDASDETVAMIKIVAIVR
jgi:hypothetical protein